MSTIEKAAARLVKKSKAPDASIDQQSGFDRVMDDGVSDDLQTNISNPTVAYEHTCELDFELLRENGFLVPGHDNQRQSQEFRRIKRPLLLNLQKSLKYERPPNVVFITSALPGEGKTFVSLNLALSLAGELDKSVLLVDGDAAKGDMSRWLGIHEENGLLDLLSDDKGQRDPEKAVIATNIERLSVMSSGGRQDNLDELYSSELMKGYIERIASRDPNRIVIVDGPPLIATTEAAVLAHLMGQTVLVVEANKTPQSAVEQAISHLEGSQLVSVLLNKAESSGPGGYGYGYGYGYGNDRDEQKVG